MPRSKSPKRRIKSRINSANNTVNDNNKVNVENGLSTLLYHSKATISSDVSEQGKVIAEESVTIEQVLKINGATTSIENDNVDQDTNSTLKTKEEPHENSDLLKVNIKPPLSPRGSSPSLKDHIFSFLVRFTINPISLATAVARWRWYDANGEGPFMRFLRADDPTNPLPTLRVGIMLLLGFLLSVSVIWLSEDEFFEGTADHARFQELNSNFPVHIAFKDTGCLISGMNEPALHNITGSIPTGKLTGVLGQSGSGKTLFSYQLLGRGRKFCSQGSKGQVYLNGHPRSLEAFLDRVGFVPQEDILYGDLTVEETLQFSANWRLPRAMPDSQKMGYVNETINVLGLNRIRKSKVGCMRERGISGGERRRVSIGMELVAQPSVLVADEPTTGLDGAGAYQLVKNLRSIVDERRGSLSVVLVIHQPSARVFDLLQHVILMARGTIVFSGSPGEATSFLSEAGFVYKGVNDPQRRSAAEYILDVLSGEEKREGANQDERGVDSVARILHAKWREKFERENMWRKIEQDMAYYHQRESEILKEIHEGMMPNSDDSGNIWAYLLHKTGFLDHCRDPIHQAELWCVVVLGTPFPVLPKPGLRKQLHMWFWQMVRITVRQGIKLQLFVILSLAVTVAFVRSFNHSWSRRPHANFVLSIVICLLGMLGAVFSDDVGPVQRAAASGMILAAHELAQLAFALIMGWLQCHWFAFIYFTFLWLRTGVWCCTPFRFEKYYEFTHILHLHFLVSSGIGSCICAITNHSMRASFILAIGNLMHFHTYALFSPSKNQAEKDTKILFGKIDIAPLVMFYAKWSYVRYFLEAIMVWEPDADNDRVGRAFMMRYFSWEEQHFVADLTWLFALWTLSLSIRFVFFAVSNANAYNSAYDIPLFLVFLGKVLVLHVTALIMMTFVHELYIATTTWKDNVKHGGEVEDKKE